MATDGFFDRRSDWARRKHLVLTYYLEPAVKKLRYASPDRRVFVLDGFAGPGAYVEGTPGSPTLTGNLAANNRVGEKPLEIFIHNIELESLLQKSVS